MESIKGTKMIAQRIVNAENAFIEVLMDKGFSKDDSEKAMRVMLKLKVAKLDAVGGRITVKHGIYLEFDSILAAVEFKG